MNNYYNYWILDNQKPGKYHYEGMNFCFLFEPFYTGISVNRNRINEHLSRSYKDKCTNTLKENKIRKIKRETNQDSYFVISDENLSKNESINLEKYYISIVGRRDKGNGSLTNMTDGGEGIWGYRWTNQMKEKRRKERSINKYHILSPSKEIFLVESLKQFCKNNKLTYSGMLNMIKGKQYSYKGWIGHIIGQENLRDNCKPKFYALDPSKTLYEIADLKTFCKIHNLKYKNVRDSLYKKDRLKANGWIFANNLNKQKRI